MSGRCIVCDKDNSRLYNKEENGYFCSECNYWINRTKGETYDWKELSEALEEEDKGLTGSELSVILMVRGESKDD